MACEPKKIQSQLNRNLALQNGEKTYVSVTVCKHCDTYEKYVSSYACVQCNIQKNRHKLFDNSLMKKYRTKPKRNAITYRYRMRKKNQMPIDADNEKILSFYREAERLTEETGIIHHVDHIIPISKGGLHHQDNLQVLTKKENLSKGNKLL
jgi:5-methylcytosine-specific restriction endonuclease McrA